MAIPPDAGLRPDADLAAARAGDRGAFARVVAANYDFVFRVAWRWTGNREDAEDIAQDVCMRLARSIRDWRGEGTLRTWLYSVTLNAVRDHGRRLGRQRRLAEAAQIHALVEGGTALPEPAEDPAEALWLAVRELPQQQRDAVLLVHGEGLSHSAAAQAMGCAEKTVSWHIHEARKRLKQMLAAGGTS